jgi:hypothetical protein
MSQRVFASVDERCGSRAASPNHSTLLSAKRKRNGRGDKNDIPCHASLAASASHLGNAGGGASVSGRGIDFEFVYAALVLSSSKNARPPRRQGRSRRGVAYSVAASTSFGGNLSKVSNVFLISVTRVSHLPREKSSRTTTRMSLSLSL